MKRVKSGISLFLALGILVPWAALPTRVHAGAPVTQPSVTDDDDEIHLAPVPVGKGDENKRINMAARGGPGAKVFVICPVDTAFTSSPQPVLYWAISDDTDQRIDIAVIEPMVPAPLFKQTIHGVKKGLHRVDLSDINHPGKPLQQGKTYLFKVSLTEHQANATEATFASGSIRLVDTPAIDHPTPAKLAGEGLWFEAVDLLCRRIDNDPTNTRLLKHRDEVLRKEGVFVDPGAVANSGDVLENQMLDLLDAPSPPAGK